MAVFLDDRLSGAGSFNGHTAATGGAWATDTSLWSAGSASNSGSPDDFLFDGSVSAYKSAATPGSANYRVDYDVKMVGAGNGIAAVFARWSTGGSGYQFGIEEGSGSPRYTLRRYNSGSIDGTYASTSSSYTPDTSVHQLSIEVLAGGVVKGYFDGAEVLTFTDASPITSAGYVAVGGREFRISDAVATDDTGGGGSSTTPLKLQLLMGA